MIINNTAEDYLENLAKELLVPETRYEEAVSRYKAIGAWLKRDASTLKQFSPEVYVQGSFRLGTAIRPNSEDEEYDIDAVCVLEKLTKNQLTQSQLKDLIGDEIKSYRISNGIKKPAVCGRRCWTLEYADGAQFHLDILPAIPEDETYSKLLLERKLSSEYTDTSIAITDNQHLDYEQISSFWPRSNPKGYALWFISKMKDEFHKRKQMVFEDRRDQKLYSTIEEVPDYAVRTPLQSAIMLLKHHRDVFFHNKNSDDKPISIIISTLSAHAYRNESTTAQALMSILDNMPNYIEHRSEQYYIKNPTDPLENFADKWADHPERKEAFYLWFENCLADFQNIMKLENPREISDVLETNVGQILTEKVMKTMLISSSLLQKPAQASSSFTFPDTQREPTKPKGFA